MVERLSASGESGGGGASAAVVALVRHRLIELDLCKADKLDRVEEKTEAPLCCSLSHELGSRGLRKNPKEEFPMQEIVEGFERVGTALPDQASRFRLRLRLRDSRSA